MGKIKFDHRGLCFQKNTVIKKWTRNNQLEEWFRIYQDLQKFDSSMVKIIDVDTEQNYFVMERLHGLCMEKQIDHLHFEHKKEMFIQTCDIFNSILQFKSSLLQKDEIFFSVDFRLANLIYTEEGKVRLVDPDSFEVVNLRKRNNFLLFGRYFDCVTTLKEQMSRDLL